jgi:hypothetical protein
MQAICTRVPELSRQFDSKWSSLTFTDTDPSRNEDSLAQVTCLSKRDQSSVCLHVSDVSIQSNSSLGSSPVFVLSGSTDCIEDDNTPTKHPTRIQDAENTMDLLRSLIVPPPLVRVSGPTNALSRNALHAHCTAATSRRVATDNMLQTLSAGPTPYMASQHESAKSPTKKQKWKQNRKQNRKKKKKKKKKKAEETKAQAQPTLPPPAAIRKELKRKRSQFFHSDQPRADVNKRFAVSHEDLYDDASIQQPESVWSSQSSRDQAPSRQNCESAQTCFFWYHGTCRRAQACQLKHALLDPPSMVVAPPKFVHPRSCELEWCAGDGPPRIGDGPRRADDGPRGGNRTPVKIEQRRYFDVAVSDDKSSCGSANKTAEDSFRRFLEGFDEPDAETALTLQHRTSENASWG